MRTLTILCAAALALPLAVHADTGPRDGVYLGVTNLHLRTDVGPHAFTALGAPPFEVSRAQFRHSGSAPGIEMSLPLRPWLSLDLVATSAVSTRGDEIWTGDHDLVLDTDTRTSVLLGTVSLRYPLGTRVTLYGRAGALHVETRTDAVDAAIQRPVAQFRDSDVRPWAGIGVRYAVHGGLTVTGEYGAAGDGFRSQRIGLGWTF